MANTDVLLHIFVFLLRVCLFTAVGIALHRTEGSQVLSGCPGLWESMTFALVVKCLRMTLCAVGFNLLRAASRTPMKGLGPFDLFLHTGLFIVECVTTSRSLNTPACIEVSGHAFDGHPLLAYLNGISCAWDGCFVLSYALFAVLNR